MFIAPERHSAIFIFSRLAAASLGCCLLAACSPMLGPTIACTDELRSVVRVDVVDSLTGAPTAAGSTVWLRGASFADSVIVPDTLATATAAYWFEDRVKAGTYSLEIRKSGYAPWARSNIRIEANRCHVTTFDFVTARLRRL